MNRPAIRRTQGMTTGECSTCGAAYGEMDHAPEPCDYIEGWHSPPVSSPRVEACRERIPHRMATYRDCRMESHQHDQERCPVCGEVYCALCCEPCR